VLMPMRCLSPSLVGAPVGAPVMGPIVTIDAGRDVGRDVGVALKGGSVGMPTVLDGRGGSVGWLIVTVYDSKEKN